MRLRHLFESNAGGSQTIGICYGRFNPPHKGHRHVWEECAKNPVWFVGTNKNTGGSDAKNPLPYDVKLQCMEAVWPEVAGHVIPEQDLFVMAAHIYAKYGEHVHLKVYTDEQWLYAGLVKSNGVEQKHGYFKFANITHEPTQRLASATDLRKAVREGDQESFYQDMGIDPGTTIQVGKQSMSMFDIVAHYLNQFPVKASKVAAENTEEKKKKWSDYGMPEPVEQKPKEKRFHGWDEFAHEKEKKQEKEVAETIIRKGTKTGAELQKGLNSIRETNQVLRDMRAKHLLSEISTKPTGKPHQHHIDGGQGYTLFRDVGGYDRVYHLNRMMMAAAMADGRSKKPVDMDASSWFEKYNIAFPYSDIEAMMVNQALATIPSDAGELEKRGKSSEPVDTNKVSPVAKPKRNKYGI